MTGGRGVDIVYTQPEKVGFHDSRSGSARTFEQWGSRVKSIGFHTGAVLLALAIGGCAALPGGGPAPLDTFELSAPAVTTKARDRRQILIAEPSALKALDGQNIVIKPSARSIQYLKGAQWADRLPLIVQARLAETFQRAGSFAGVGKPGEGLAIDYQIIVEIRSFEVRVDGGQHANVELFVRVLNDRNGEVRAAHGFTASVPVSGTGNQAYIGALDKAFGEAAQDIVRWTDTVI